MKVTQFAESKLRPNKLMKLKANEASRGFAVLYAVLVSSILLSIGLAIFNITIKELLFSSLGRESQFAFYAADTGAECALYWNFANNSFSTSSPVASVNCVDTDAPVVSTGPPVEIPDLYRRVFTLYLDPTQVPIESSPCTVVSVLKYESPSKTVIEARGYNTCDTNNPRRVERAIRVTF